MNRKLSPVMLALAACGQAAGGTDPSASSAQPPEPAWFERPAMVRFHMARHFDDLRLIERLLIAGKLDEAKTTAFLLTRPPPDPGMARWATTAVRVTDAARELVAAPNTDEALRREARVAAACGNCHMRTQKLPIFAAPPPLPQDSARMARHQWAVDRLWEAIVGGAEHPWKQGMEVLAATPLPYSPLSDAPALAATLQAQARAALQHQIAGTDTLDDRAATYGELLVTCAGCHDSTRAPGSR